jgi:hypothetical protein
MHPAIYDLMKQAGRQGRTLTYSDLAPLANLDMNNPGDRQKIAHILDDISSHEHGEGRPLLSALVVRGDVAGGGLPGAGFFKLSRRLGVQPAGQDNVAFFAAELTRVFDVWKTCPA